MFAHIWCKLWLRLQDFAFWVDDKTRTCYAGHLVTGWAEKFAPRDF